jgi:hypothetical protein
MSDFITKLQNMKQGDRDADLDIAIACGVAEKGAETWGPYLRRKAARRPYTSSANDVLALIDTKLRPLHPHMTIKVSGTLAAPYDWFMAEITWPSHEMQASGHTPATALCAVFMKAWRDSQ